MLNQVDYSMGGPQGNEFMDEDGNIIGYGPSYGDKDSIDLTPSFDMFAKYDDEQSVALAAETISGQKELGVTTYNIDGTVSTVPPGLDKSDTPTAQEQAAADKAAEKAAMESGIAANLIPAPDFYRGNKTTKSIEDGGFITDFYRINKAGEYVDNTGKNRKEGWAPEAGGAPDPAKGENFYFGAYGELQSGSTKNNTDLPWFSPPTPGYTKSPQQGTKPKHTKEDGSIYYSDPQGSGMYIQNIDNKQSKNQIQTQLNKQKAERAYNQMTKEWTFDYLRATGDKKKTKKQAYAFLDRKVQIMDSWGTGQGGAGFGGARKENKADLKKRIKQAYGQRNTETQNFYGMLNRQQPQNNKKGPGIMFGSSTTWDEHLSDPNYSY